MSDRETIELKLDEANELLFKVTIQGADAAPAKVRLVCEGEDISYMFEGHSTDNGDIRFVVPEMKKSIADGAAYTGRIEVLVENRYFTPVEFDIAFKQSMKVVAESVKLTPTTKKPANVVVQASIQKAPPATVQEAPKPRPIVTAPPRKQSLAEKYGRPTSQPVEKPAVVKTVTGLSDLEMEEVARSSVRRLLGK